MAHAARLVQLAGPDAERVDLEPGALKDNPARLLETAASPSLFGAARVIRILGIDDSALGAVELLLEADIAGDRAIGIGPALTKRSALVKLVEAAPNAISAALYTPTGKDAEQLAIAIAREQGLRLAGDTARRIAEATAGDRTVMARELEKLALYLDAAPDRPGEVTPETLDAVGADLEDAGLFRAIDAIVAGRIATLADELALLAAAGTAPVVLLRTLVRRLMTLAAMRADVDKGSDPKDVVKAHRIFWKEEAATAKALEIWSSADLARAIDHARRTERALMSSAGAGDVLADAACVTLARTAARRR